MRLPMRLPLDPRRWLGDRGERLAARHLRQAGLRILARGIRAGRGEIDLLARDGDSLVFIEVKTRRHGDPADAVTPEKQLQIARTAHLFLARHHLLDSGIPCRFDVVAIVWPADRRQPPQLAHLRDAFPAPNSP